MNNAKTIIINRTLRLEPTSDPIVLGIGNREINLNVIPTSHASVALCAMPNKQPCIVITEMEVNGRSNHGTVTDGVTAFASECKVHNKDCYVILYASNLLALKKADKSFFDLMIDSSAEDALEELLDAIEILAN